MAGQSDGSAIKDLFSPNKGDPLPQKKKIKSPSPQNAPPPEQKEKSSPHKTQSGKLLSPDKNHHCPKIQQHLTKIVNLPPVLLPYLQRKKKK